MSQITHHTTNGDAHGAEPTKVPREWPTWQNLSRQGA
jgi:hypothetical protein